MRGRVENGQKTRKLVLSLLTILFLSLIYFYTQSQDTSSIQLKSLKRFGTSLSSDDETDSSTHFDEENNHLMLKSIPVSTMFLY